VAPLGAGRYRVSWEGGTTETEVKLGSDGAFLFSESGRWRRVAGTRQGDRGQLWVDGDTADYAVRRGSRSAAGSHDADLTSAAPGVVSQVLVAAGAAVHKGEKLVVIESMKMFFPVIAPRDGVVARVLCAQGETVEAGVALVELREEPA
jgi:3-methylcrotonyl-CoA carboxylase alpha subunit